MKGRQGKGGGATTAEADAAGAAASAGAKPKLNDGAPPPPFLSKTYDMVDDTATDAVVSWGADNNSFVVWNATEFARDLLPKYFKHNNFSSFVRQLNTYGFRKVDPDRWEFANEGFLRGKKNLLKMIDRRKSTQAQNQLPQPQTCRTSVGTIELGNFGFEEQIERLKRDKSVLMQELVKLRQQQQGTDNQVKTLGQRLQGMEQRQQQMMAFLATAMKNPGFFAQLVQQNENNCCITSGNKKRRLPGQENNLEGKCTEQNGQIVKYQPLINEAAKAMLMQILKFETSLGDSESFLLRNVTSLSTFESPGSLRRNSGVTLSEVPASSDVPAASGYSTISSSTPSKNPSCTDIVYAAKMPMANNSITKHSPVDAAPCIQNPVNAASGSSLAPDGESIYVEPNPEFVDDLMGIGASNTDMEILSKLPSIIDPFWEHFLASSMLFGDAEEVDSSTYEDGEAMAETGNNGWESSRSMDSLSEQMENLASTTIM